MFLAVPAPADAFTWTLLCDDVSARDDLEACDDVSAVCDDVAAHDDVAACHDAGVGARVQNKNVEIRMCTELRMMTRRAPVHYVFDDVS